MNQYRFNYGKSINCDVQMMGIKAEWLDFWKPTSKADKIITEEYCPFLSYINNFAPPVLSEKYVKHTDK